MLFLLTCGCGVSENTLESLGETWSYKMRASAFCPVFSPVSFFLFLLNKQKQEQTYSSDLIWKCVVIVSFCYCQYVSVLFTELRSLLLLPAHNLKVTLGVGILLPFITWPGWWEPSSLLQGVGWAWGLGLLGRALEPWVPQTSPSVHMTQLLPDTGSTRTQK
jgi:hypothetical protein